MKRGIGIDFFIPCILIWGSVGLGSWAVYEACWWVVVMAIMLVCLLMITIVENIHWYMEQE